MMKIKSVIFDPIFRLGLACLSLVMGFNSCSLVWMDQEDCPQGLSLQFVYDLNMEFTDAFNKKVHCVSVLVFDEDGNHLTTLEETTDALRDENYRMELDLEPGNYTLVAYGGHPCENSSFSIPQFGTKSSDHISSLYAEMEHDNFVSDDAKHDFYHGIHSFSVVENKVSQEKVYLTKNTNNIRIVLQQMNGEAMSASDFTFEITDDNSIMDHKNNVVPAGTVTYLPYATGEAVVGTAENGETPFYAAYAEFSTSRLTTGTSPKLVIRSVKEDRDVINIPLNTYLLLLKSELYKDMSNQEYFDRESVWSMVFFLDPGHRWINTHIVVNDWTVRINDSEF